MDETTAAPAETAAQGEAPAKPKRIVDGEKPAIFRTGPERAGPSYIRGRKPSGWVDQVLHGMTDEHLDGDKISDEEKSFAVNLADRRQSGDRRLLAADLNTLKVIANKLGIKHGHHDA